MGKNKKDSLGDRMKTYYEDRFRSKLLRRTYTVIRVDGKAFHTLTKSFEKPFDTRITECMDNVALELCRRVQNAVFAYVQSDEVSVLLTDFNDTTTQMWYDGNIQKVVSVSASIASNAFNSKMYELDRDAFDAYPNRAEFDSRVFQLPTSTEVYNYFLWRQQDATRNSISSLAQSKFSHKQLQGVSSVSMLGMLSESGHSWEQYPLRLKYGGLCLKTSYVSEVDMGKPALDAASIDESIKLDTDFTYGETAQKWDVSGASSFYKSKRFIGMIPVNDTPLVLDGND